MHDLRTPRRFTHAWALLVLMTGMSAPLMAQENQFNQPWRLTYNDHDHVENTITPRVSYHDTQNECERLKQWMESVNNGARALGNRDFYTNITIQRVGAAAQNGLLETISDATSAVQRAKAMLENKDVILRGDTIKDYANTIKAVYENVKAFKARLLAETGTISRRAFAQVNNQIVEYNRQAAEYNALIRSADLYARLEAADNANRPKGKGAVKNFYAFDPARTIEPVNESDLRGRLESGGDGGGSLAGREGTGTFGSGRIKAAFQNDTVVFGEGASTNRGTFRQHGNNVVMSTAGYDYYGTILGNRIVGTRTAKDASGVNEPWQIQLGAIPSIQGTEELVGKTWEISTSGGADIVWDGTITTVFHADGTNTRFVAANPISGNPARALNYTWTRDGSTIMVRDQEGTDYLFKGTLSGNQIDGMVYRKDSKPWRQIWRVK